MENLKYVALIVLEEFDDVQKDRRNDRQTDGVPYAIDNIDFSFFGYLLHRSPNCKDAVAYASRSLRYVWSRLALSVFLVMNVIRVEEMYLISWDFEK